MSDFSSTITAIQTAIEDLTTEMLNLIDSMSSAQEITTTDTIKLQVFGYVRKLMSEMITALRGLSI